MATSDHLGLYLPTREDYISVKRDLSDNYEVLDEAIEMLDNGIAIVVNGDNAPTSITNGQYLFIKNHSTLATGGYHATSNIANGAAVTSSNVAADSDGIVNALNSNFNTIVDPKQNSKKLVTRITKNYTNVSIGADGYASIDTTTTILSGVPYASSYALISMMIQSFSNGNIYSLARGSTMANIYVIGKPNSTVTFGVQYFFMNTTLDTQSY